MSHDGIIVEVALPLRVSHAWIAFASQKAGLGRPRWDHVARVWTVVPGPIRMTCPGGDRTLRVTASATDEEAVRSFVTALFTGMFQRTRRGNETERR